MKKWLVVFFLLIVLPAKATLFLMPWPSHIEQAGGVVALGGRVKISLVNLNEKQTQFIINELSIRLSRQANRPIQTEISAAERADLLIEITNSKQAKYPFLGMDEQYQLNTLQRPIRISAANYVGVIRGLETLLQLSNVEPHRVAINRVNIIDKPRFPWRGLMIDSVRHFISIETIRRQIDAMASAKLNVFHWHLTDDQGWRIPIDGYDKLIQHASDGLYYSHDEIRFIVQYAASKGIRVVPEVDFPGHASAIAVAYPELISQNKNYGMQRHWGVFEPVLDPTNPDVFTFIEGVIKQLSELFPDEFVHIGGDEVNPKQWQANPSIQAFIKTNNFNDEHGLHAWFNQRMQSILNQYGKKVMGWDEIFHPSLNRDIMIQSWRGLDSIRKFTNHGFDGLLSTGFYIDQPQPTSYHYRNDPLAPVATIPSLDTAQVWAITMPRLKGSAVKALLFVKGNNAFIRLNNNPIKPVRNFANKAGFMSFNVDTWMGPLSATLHLTQDNQRLTQSYFHIGNTPYAVSGYSTNQVITSETSQVAAVASKVLGGEATIWAELINDSLLDGRVWPRTYAIAERLWSPATRTDERNMYQRLAMTEQWAVSSIGLTHKKNQEQLLGNLSPHNIQPLLLLSEAVEQAQYYTRHHVKFTQDLYHQMAPLDQFVDSLPSESMVLVELHYQLQDFKHSKNVKHLKQIRFAFERWQTLADTFHKLAKTSPSLSTILPLVNHVSEVSRAGLIILNANNSSRALTEKERNYIEKLVAPEQRRHGEIINSAAILVSELLTITSRP